MVINVTQIDIDRGIPGTANACPVHYALSRAFDCPVDVAFSVCYPWIGKKRGIDLPQNVQKWIRQFDNGQKIFPIEFELNYELNIFAAVDQR